MILGASGFAGAELLRILARHPMIEVVAAGASRQVGVEVSSLYPGIDGYPGMRFAGVEEALEADADVVFSSLPHGRSMEVFGGGSGRDTDKVVDLSGDFRLRDPSVYEAFYGELHSSPEVLGEWAYGLTELNRDEVRRASRVANPGCYPAAVLLVLVPLAEASLIEGGEVSVYAASGVSGAGRASGEGFDFTSVTENFRPYGVTGHKHIPEMEQALGAATSGDVTVSFIPHLAPMVRGIVATCVCRAVPGVKEADLQQALAERYRDEPFIRVLEAGRLPETKRLAGTNLCEVTARLDDRSSRVLAFGALDNLGKGAASSAVQNANLMLGLDEATGLDLQPLVL